MISFNRFLSAVSFCAFGYWATAGVIVLVHDGRQKFELSWNLVFLPISYALIWFVVFAIALVTIIPASLIAPTSFARPAAPISMWLVLSIGFFQWPTLFFHAPFEPLLLLISVIGGLAGGVALVSKQVLNALKRAGHTA